MDTLTCIAMTSTARSSASASGAISLPSPRAPRRSSTAV